MSLHPHNNLITLRGSVSWHLQCQPLEAFAGQCASQQKVGSIMNSLTVPLQDHWSNCQSCPNSKSDSILLTWNEGTNILGIFSLAFHLRSLHQIRLFHCLPWMAVFYLSPPFFYALGSKVILCSFTHLFPSSLLMLPVVHHGAGSAPKQADTMTVSVLSWVPVPPQSTHSTDPSRLLFHSLPFTLQFCLSSLLQIYFFSSV